MKTAKYTTLLAILLSSATIFSHLNDIPKRMQLGVFNAKGPQLDGIKWGNWGSRPYEYYWAASVASISGKNVIDLGVGLPSQYDWYRYAVNQLHPKFYVGIDADGRMKNEEIITDSYKMLFMNMADIAYPENSFDIAYCISTYEHIPYDVFIETIKETYRVLKDDGVLIITLDEEWDMSQKSNYSNGWNTLELTLVEKNMFTPKNRTFGLPEFLELIKDYFVPYLDEIVHEDGKLISKVDGTVYYDRKDKDPKILNSGLPTNSCVSYAILKKKITTLLVD